MPLTRFTTTVALGILLLLPFAAIASAQQCIEAHEGLSLESNRLVGPGHCTDETVGYITNRSGQTVDCFYSFYENGRPQGQGMGTIRPGQRAGGEGGGTWACNADVHMRYICFVHTQSSFMCGANVNWNR